MRGETFVTRKITQGLTRIAAGKQDCIHLGNLGALRDWGHARDYVRAQWLMMQQPVADDFVIATGEQRSVREFVESAGKYCDMRIEWHGRDDAETGIDSVTGKTVIRVDPRYYRPTDVSALVGDASKARARLGWRPEVSFDALVREMVEHDTRLARDD